MNTDQSRLDYAKPIPRWQQKRIQRGILLVLCAIGVISGGWIVWHVVIPRWQESRRRAQNVAVWEQCLQYQGQPGCVVYDEDPSRCAELLKDPQYFQLNYQPGPIVARRWPQDQPRIIKIATWMQHPQDSATLLFCERGIPALPHERQLVIITGVNTRAGYTSPHNLWEFRASCVLKAWTGEIGIRMYRIVVPVPEELNDPKHKVRFFEGKPDPNDVARFTIGYEVDDEPGTIDGWITPEVVLKVRDGPATRPAY